MTNYDPVGTQPEGPIIKELPYISIQQTTDEVVITW
jgi:hypothetical protein